MTDKETNKYNNVFSENQTDDNDQTDKFSESSDPSASSEETTTDNFENPKNTEITDSCAESYNSESQEDSSCSCEPNSKGESDSSCTKHFTLYAGLAVAFLFILFIYNFLEIRSLNSELKEVTGKLNAVNSSINKFESITVSLELKKSLLVIDELILSGNKPTKEAAEKAKLNLLALKETLEK